MVLLIAFSLILVEEIGGEHAGNRAATHPHGRARQKGGGRAKHGQGRMHVLFGGCPIYPADGKAD